MKERSFTLREATLEDLPQFEALVNHPEWRMFIRQYVKKRISQSNRYLYVICEHKSILGTGCITALSKDMAWLGGIRVHDDFYNQGIGTRLFEHGITYAEKQGFTSVIFDTTYDTKGTIRIAEKVGASRIADLDAIYGNPCEIQVDPGYLNQIPVDKAMDSIRSVPHGPDLVLCIGFDLVYPLEQKTLDEHDIRVYGTARTILLENEIKKEFSQERVTDVVLYGLKDDAKGLLCDAVQRAQERGYKKIRVLGSQDIIKIGLDLQLKYPKGERFGLAIFKKDLRG